MFYVHVQVAIVDSKACLGESWMVLKEKLVLVCVFKQEFNTVCNLMINKIKIICHMYIGMYGWFPVFNCFMHLGILLLCYLFCNGPLIFIYKFIDLYRLFSCNKLSIQPRLIKSMAHSCDRNLHMLFHKRVPHCHWTRKATHTLNSCYTTNTSSTSKQSSAL